MATFLSMGAAAAVFIAAAFKGGHDIWIATVFYLAALALAAGLVLWSAWSGRGPKLDGWVLAGAAAVLAAFGASFLRSANPSEAWLELMDWAAALAVFYVALHAFREERVLERCLPLAALYAFPAFLLALRWLRYEEGLPPSVDTVGKTLRWLLSLQNPGSFTNANASAGFLLLWLPALFLKARAERASGARSAFWRLGFALSMTLFLMANSAWGFLCLAFQAALLWRGRLLSFLRRRRVLAAGVALGAALAAAAIVAGKLTQSLDTSGQPIPLADRVARIAWWRAGLAMFRDHPWLGVGPGNYGSAYLAYKAPEVRNTLFAHSLPVALLAETGLAGAFAVLLLAAGLRRRTAGGPLREPYWIGAAGFAAFSLISLGTEYLGELAGAALALGIAAAPAVRGNLKPRKSAALALAAAAAAAIPWLSAPFLASRLYVSGERALRDGDADKALASFRLSAEADPRAFEPERALARLAFERFRRGGAPEDAAAAALHQGRAVERNRLDPRLRAELDAYKKFTRPQ